MKFLKIFIILVFAFVIACKKEKKQPDVVNDPPVVAVEYKKLKCSRTIDINASASSTQIVNCAYNYNSEGKLIYIKQIDSVTSGTIFSTAVSFKNYSYASNNKISQIEHIMGSFNGSTFYAYDQNGKLSYSYGIYGTMFTDTTYYSNSGNLIVAELQTSTAVYRDYYSNNLDSSIGTTFSVTGRTFTNHNTKKDLLNAYLNKYLPIVDNDTELISITYLPTSSTPTTYSRIYDGDNYPIRVIQVQSNITSYIDYSYY